MAAEATEHADVVVVGAGPTGLMLAGDLVEAGVRVVLLERRAGESNLARAFAVHARTMEQLQIRGVAAELAASGTTIGKLVLYGRAAIDLSRLPSRYPSLLIHRPAPDKILPEQTCQQSDFLHCSALPKYLLRAPAD